MCTYNWEVSVGLSNLPSDFMKKSSRKCIRNYEVHAANSLKKQFFRGDLEGAISIQNRMFQGSLFVIISCQRVPEGLERHLDAARQKLPRYNFCRSIALTAGAILKAEKSPLLWGEAIWEAF